ncbi:hypothetical protein ACQ86D_36955 [Streptomyces galilaeus]
MSATTVSLAVGMGTAGGTVKGLLFRPPLVLPPVVPSSEAVVPPPAATTTPVVDSPVSSRLRVNARFVPGSWAVTSVAMRRAPVSRSLMASASRPHLQARSARLGTSIARTISAGWGRSAGSLARQGSTSALNCGSTSRGPSAASSTAAGHTPACDRFCPCSTASASASATASARRVRSGSGPPFTARAVGSGSAGT